MKILYISLVHFDLDEIHLILSFIALEVRFFEGFCFVGKEFEEFWIFSL
jgi:hypothetical protein